MLRVNPEENLHNQLSAFLELNLERLKQQADTAQELNLELLQEEQETQRYLKLIWSEVDYLKAFIERSPQEQSHENFQQGYQIVLHQVIDRGAKSLITYLQSQEANLNLDHQRIYEKVTIELLQRGHLLRISDFNLTYLNGQRIMLEQLAHKVNQQLSRIMAQREPLMNTYVDLASHQQQMTRQLLPVFEGVKQRYHQTFHALCEQGQVEAVKQYLKDLSSYKRQRLVKQIDDYGRLPLHLAAINGHTATVSFLLGQGANLMQLDGGGFTAWHRAAEGGEVGIFEALVKALPKRERLENHINSVTTPEGYTPLSTAAFHGHDKTVKWLINNGANVNQVISHDGSTALHAATVRGQLICVRLLLNARANGHLSNSQGETPAFLAVYYHQPHIVAELMGHGICLTQAEFEHILELGNRDRKSVV